ncbi:MAG TPA: lipoprotein-releasing ABC transporter permease subunit [Steroidobacteraceae bacterium]|nr:lipoprotein-releasing ABC transporter permease subunit [Steroidobacteraceae bacterium]
MSAWPALESRIAVRYLRARTDNRFLSFSTVVGALGVAIGVTVLIVVLSVMNGFEVELKERILSVAAHATLSGVDGPLGDWRAIEALAVKRPHVLAVAPYVEERGLLAHGARVSGVLVHGIDPAEERRVGSLAEHVRDGTLASLAPASYAVLLGKGLAEELGVRPGDSVVLAAPRGIATPAGVVPRVRRLRVAGIIDSGLYEYDRNVAVMNLEDAARLFRLGSAVTGLRLKVDDPYAAGRIVRTVAVDLGGGFYISDWTRQHANFFRSIATTKSIMFVLLLLVIAVAAFNIVATLVMLVREKQGDIAILRTLGLAPASLVGVFVIQGTVIGALGTLSGVVLGVTLADHLTAAVHALESLLRVTLFDPRVYYIEQLPSVVSRADLTRIAATAFTLSCLSTLYPAWRAARTQPAEALRHE